MKKLIATAILLLMASALASAQNADHAYRAEGYGFLTENAPQGPSGGFGGVVFLYRGLGVNGELAEAPWDFAQLSTFGKDSVFKSYITSINLYYGGPSTNEKKGEPFVTAGYSAFSTSSALLAQPNGVNVGVGENLWLAKRVALRLEFRLIHGGRTVTIHDNDWGWTYTSSAQNIFSLRVGLTFR